MTQMKYKSKLSGKIAVVGIACRFPDAEDYEQFWNNIIGGVDSIKDLRENRWLSEKYNQGVFLSSDLNVCGYDGLLGDIDKFDYSFFNISPREAKYMDPQHRVLLEETVHCVEDSGISVSALRDKMTSVYIGQTGNDYDLFTLSQGENVDNYTSLGSFHCLAANRISHFLGLKGVSLTLDTACSSSLVSIHMAKQSLITKESDYAIAGGVCLAYHPWRYVSFSKSHMMSIDGSCKTCDEDANGFVQGEGVGVLLLQRLEDAIRDHNHIYGVISGSAVNHCGDSLTIAAPKMEAQKNVILSAIKDSGVSFEDITYVETHGTGTTIGDPIEVDALINAFRTETQNEYYCGLGSVKTNIGHLGSAAGVAGVIKVLMMMKYQQIPKLLHHNKKNSLIHFEHSPFMISLENCEWVATNGLRCAGVSGFGFGGVNAHLIMEEWKESDSVEEIKSDNTSLFVLSGKNPESLEELVGKWKNFLPSCKENINDICATLATGRNMYDYRVGAVVNNKNELVQFIHTNPEAEHGDTNNDYVLLFGDCTIISNKEVECLKEFSEVEQVLDELELKIQDLPNEIVTVCYQYAAGKYLMHLLSRKPLYLIYRGIGIWTCMVLSQMKSLKNTIEYLLGKRNENFVLMRPEIPIYDYKMQSVHYKREIDKDYILYLMDNTTITSEESSFYQEKGRVLYKKQRTFQKFFMDWCEVSKDYGIDLKSLLVEKNACGKDEVLLVTAIIHSINRLNMKWNLQKDLMIESATYKELLNLCCNEVISNRVFMKSLFPTDNWFEEIADDIKLAKIDEGDSMDYAILNKKSMIFMESQSAIDWIEENQKNSEVREHKYIIIGCGCLEKEADYTIFQLGSMQKEILRLWLSGQNIDFNVLYDGKAYKKIPLPTYAFRKDECWIESTACKGLHPMIDSNESTIDHFVMKKSISLADFYVRDHIVNNQVIVPGVFYLEMARKAGEIATGHEVTELSNIMWLQTCVLDQNRKDIYVTVSKRQSYHEFEIYGFHSREKILYAQGRLHNENEKKNPKCYQVADIIARCNYSFDHKVCYEDVFKSYIGFDYKNGFQVTDIAYGNNLEGVEELTLPEFLEKDASDYVLHPSILDAALRAITWIGGEDAYKQKVLHIPFALGKLEIMDKLPRKAYSYARLSEHSTGNSTGSKRYDISILNEQGYEVVRIYDFTIRGLKEKEERKARNTFQFYKKELVKSKDTISEQKWKAVYIQLGEGIKEIDENHFIVGACDVEQTRQLCERLKARSNKVEHLIYKCESETSGKNEGTKLFSANKAGLITLLTIMQSLKKMDMNLKQISVITSVGSGISASMMTGFFKSIKSLFPKVMLRTVQYEGIDDSQCLETEQCIENEGAIDEVIYQGATRMISQVVSCEVEAVTDVKIVVHGVYYITGALGGIGRKIAEYLAEKYQAILVLSGRSPESEETNAFIQHLMKLGCTSATYYSCDITKKRQLERTVRSVLEAYGSINGVFHCAGVTDQKSFDEATAKDYEKVLQTKALGAIYIDQVLKHCKLDFFMLMSSVSSIIGDYQRGSYSAANGFLDSFAKMRNKMVSAKIRNGFTIAVDWPIWTDGTMKPEGNEKEAYYSYLGLQDISTSDAMYVIETVLRGTIDQIIVASGNGKSVELSYNKKIHGSKKELLCEKKNAKTSESTVHAPSQTDLLEAVTEYLQKLIASVIGLQPEKMKLTESFDHYGIDSIMIAELNKELGQSFTEVPATLFFEYNNIQDLANYFCENHQADIETLFGDDVLDEEHDFDMAPTIVDKELFEEIQNEESIYFDEIDNDSQQEIAIIGLDGRYPQADNLDEFWEHLSAGDDCITEVPKNRWNHDLYYDSEKGKKNKVYCKWGGFLKSVDDFDPLFFNITPKEAMVIDPQERLFLETAYHAIENSGYTKNTLGTKEVGVFVGVMNGQYQLYGAEELKKGHVIDVRSTYASIANRVSYYFDFCGPSIAVDTMCSSSLTALHLACQSIRNGECKMAIVGGVNAILHPSKYVFLSEQKFGSREGKCRAFGEGGDGYVPAEGVGAFLLKPLKQAVLDKDYIYGVIKGSGMNHGGRTNGYTVPNPNAQSLLIEKVIQQSRVNPENISYLEAHGTGTQLGDPIEITGLTKAYRKYTERVGYCTIGSVKDCIGHAESAAGVASITKVLLQMQKKQFVPSIYAGNINKHIHFEKTPFKVTTELMEWMPPVSCDRRIAGVSSFGAGGSNVHVIIEDYDNVLDCKTKYPKKVWLFPLSAMNQKSLLEYANEYLRYFDRLRTSSGYEIPASEEVSVEREILDIFAEYLCVDKKDILVDESIYEYHLSAFDMEMLFGRINQTYGLHLLVSDIVEYHTIRMIINHILSEMNYTKQVLTDENYGIHVESFVQNIFAGKEAMKYRLGILFTSIADLHVKLEAFVNGKGDEQKDIFTFSEDGNITDEFDFELIKSHYFSDEKMDEVAKCWVDSSSDEWYLLYGEDQYNKMTDLPLYPFKKEKLWLEQYEEMRVAVNQSEKLNICANVELDVDMPILREHRFSNQFILAGVAQLQYVIDEFMKYRSSDCVTIKNVYWLKPLVVQQKKTIMITLSGDNEVYFEVRDKENILYSKGMICNGESKCLIDRNVVRYEKTQSSHRYTKQEVYREFEQQEIVYGPLYRGIQEMYVNDKFVHTVINGENSGKVNLTVFDGVLQSLSGYTRGMDTTFVPYMFESCTLKVPMSQMVEVDVFEMENHLYNICISSKGGEVYGKLFGVCIKELIKEKHEIEYYYPTWLQSSVEKKLEDRVGHRNIVGFYSDSLDFANRIQAFIEGIGGKVQLLSLENDNCALPKLQDGDVIWYMDWSENDCQVTENRLIPFYRFCKYLFDAGFEKQSIKIKVVTNCAYQIMGDEKVQAFGAAITAFANTIRQEVPHCAISCIDINKVEMEDNMVPLLCFEHANKIAFRAGKRYEYVWKPYESEEKVRKGFVEEGIYIILGGTGGIGYVLCQYLIREYHANVVLVGRKEAVQLSDNMKRFMDENVNRVTYYSADICNETALRGVVNSVMKQYGVIHGCVHSAALLQDSSVRNMTEESFRAVLQPKVDGLEVVQRVFKDVNLDMVLLFSSMQSMKENPGQANYAAANAYVDAFAYKLNKVFEGKVIVINWGYWDSIGLAGDQEYRRKLERKGVYSIRAKEGMRALERAITGNKLQVSAIKIDHDVFGMESIAKSVEDTVKLSPTQINESRNTRDIIDVIKEAIHDSLAIDIDDIDVLRQFSEYGVDSIVGVELVSEINKKLGLYLKTTVLFDYVNVESLASYIEEMMPKLNSQESRESYEMKMLRALANGEATVDDVMKLYL